MCRDAVLLGEGHINQLTKSISLNKVQAFLKLGIEATTETILLLGIIISVITRILAQMIEDLRILQYCAGALGKCQEFMCPEGSPKFLQGKNMSSGQHGTIVIPPNAGSATKLLGGKVSFTRVRTRYSKKGEL
jgi:hypothetical protein